MLKEDVLSKKDKITLKDLRLAKRIATYKNIDHKKIAK